MDRKSLHPMNVDLGPAAPLWCVAPTVDGRGRNLSDFMMLIPGLGRRAPEERERISRCVREVCASYGEQVVFADINMALNVLWVSVLAEPGLGARVAGSVRQRVPEALMVGGQPSLSDAVTVAKPGSGWRRQLRRLGGRARRLLSPPGD